MMFKCLYHSALVRAVLCAWSTIEGHPSSRMHSNRFEVRTAQLSARYPEFCKLESDFLGSDDALACPPASDMSLYAVLSCSHAGDSGNTKAKGC